MPCSRTLVPRSPWNYEIRELRDDLASLGSNSMRREVDICLQAERSYSQATAALGQRCRRLDDKSLMNTHNVIRQDREYFKAGMASGMAQIRWLREHMEQYDRQRSDHSGLGQALTAGSSKQRCLVDLASNIQVRSNRCFFWGGLAEDEDLADDLAGRLP
ncbi:unnamed protein product [Phytophthora fragariaefolia]|uniref:Unnamed protein product n=1 Tax=Phytophthora fragariaefolia TaxID=1490495 RepID=A0A9W7CZU7_9STRA|nr:unnamed protein product [Phytophthora fragariaefolia]